MVDKMVKKTGMGRSQSREECLSKREQHVLRPNAGKGRHRGRIRGEQESSERRSWRDRQG